MTHPHGDRGHTAPLAPADPPAFLEFPDAGGLEPPRVLLLYLRAQRALLRQQPGVLQQPRLRELQQLREEPGCLHARLVDRCHLSWRGLQAVRVHHTREVSGRARATCDSNGESRGRDRSEAGTLIRSPWAIHQDGGGRGGVGAHGCLESCARRGPTPWTRRVEGFPRSSALFSDRAGLHTGWKIKSSGAGAHNEVTSILWLVQVSTTRYSGP